MYQAFYVAAGGLVRHNLSAGQRRSICRAMSRWACDFFMASRLSWCCLPRQMPSTTLANPRLKCISRAVTSVRPFQAPVANRWTSGDHSLRGRRGGDRALHRGRRCSRTQPASTVVLDPGEASSRRHRRSESFQIVRRPQRPATSRLFSTV